MYEKHTKQIQNKPMETTENTQAKYSLTLCSFLWLLYPKLLMLTVYVRLNALQNDNTFFANPKSVLFMPLRSPMPTCVLLTHLKMNFGFLFVSMKIFSVLIKSLFLFSVVHSCGHVDHSSHFVIQKRMVEVHCNLVS